DALSAGQLSSAFREAVARAREAFRIDDEAGRARRKGRLRRCRRYPWAHGVRGSWGLSTHLRIAEHSTGVAFAARHSSASAVKKLRRPVAWYGASWGSSSLKRRCALPRL